MPTNFPVDELLGWFQKNARRLPWRKKNPLPYEVWISEIMSQQSTMPTVVAYFIKWIQRFPDFESFSKASEQDILKLWAGLGYYSRARNIFKTKEALIEFMEAHNRWPQNSIEWTSFPGVGPYTAAAISSVVFNEPVLALDGNVIRVMARFWGIQDPLNQPKDRKKLEERLKKIAEGTKKFSHGPLTQALMELGALVCKPGNQAMCSFCPLQRKCISFKNKTVAKVPHPKKRKKPINISILALVYHRPKNTNQILLRQIPGGKRLAGQWELPQWELNPEDFNSLRPKIQNIFEVNGPVKHSITHHQYRVYRVHAGAWQGSLPRGHKYADLTDPSANIIVSTLTKKLIKGIYP